MGYFSHFLATKMQIARWDLLHHRHSKDIWALSAGFVQFCWVLLFSCLRTRLSTDVWDAVVNKDASKHTFDVALTCEDTIMTSAYVPLSCFTSLSQLSLFDKQLHNFTEAEVTANLGCWGGDVRTVWLTGHVYIKACNPGLVGTGAVWLM